MKISKKLLTEVLRTNVRYGIVKERLEVAAIIRLNPQKGKKASKPLLTK